MMREQAKLAAEAWWNTLPYAAKVRFDTEFNNATQQRLGLSNSALHSYIWKIYGDTYCRDGVNDIFAFVDDDGNGELDRVECRVLFYLLAEGSVHQFTNVRFFAPLLQTPQAAPAHGYQYSAGLHHTQAPQAPASQHGLTHCNSYSQPPQAASHAVHQGLQHGNSWPQSQ
eukprot:8509-Heterococcus_DN1.PRE.1